MHQEIMATSDCWVQDVVLCDLCDKPTQQFCNSCQVSLCKECVSKHTEELNSMSHEIAHFLDRKIKLAFPDCDEHTGQRCEVHCRECTKPVCVKCIVSGSHKGHDIEELTETHRKRKQEIECETQEIKLNIIPKYKKEDVASEIKVADAKSKFDDLGKEIKSQRQLLHQEVDKVFDKFDFLNQSSLCNNLTLLNAHQKKIRLRIDEMSDTVKQNEKLLKSNNFLEVNSYKSKLNEYQINSKQIALKTPFLNSNITHDDEISIKIENFKVTLVLKRESQSSPVDDVSCLQVTTGNTRILDEALEIVTIPAIYEPLYKVFCVKETEAWIIGKNKTITRIDIHGSIKDKVMAECQHYPNDISVTKEGELLYIHGESETVKVFRNGEIETLISTPEDWRPKRLFSTRSGDILIHLRECVRPMQNRKNKIIRFRGQRIIQEFNVDEHGNPFFIKGCGSLYISENINKDVCVSDNNAYTVIALKKSGKIRFQYDGKQAKRTHPFDPRGIITDSESQIIVTDFKNNCLHILDQNGQFLGCVENCGLKNPHTLSVDAKGRLWVGSRATGNIKVIEYLKHEGTKV